jgi:mitochondrial fission protein ELM1
MKCVENWAIKTVNPDAHLKPTIWALLLPEAGFRSQVLGLAEAIGGNLVEKNIDLRAPWSLLPSNLCPFPFLGLDASLDQLNPPWPDIVIGCGRRTIPIALEIKRRSVGKTKAIYIQNPKASTPDFDLVISMKHDEQSGPNVMIIDTALHRVTQAKLDSAAQEWKTRFSAYPRPLIGVILGGRNRSFRFTEAVVDRAIADLTSLATTTGASFIITPSRRTDLHVVERFKTFAQSLPNVTLWDGAGDNPYFGMLALCDGLIVTEDSVSMVSEAIASKKPVATIPLEGHAPRHLAFIENLLEKGAIRRFHGQLPVASEVTLPDYTHLAAEQVKRLLVSKP